MGAGFSAAAGLPLADDLWKEVLRRARGLTGRASQFKQDMDDYIEYKKRTEGIRLSYQNVNFEEFLGYLDVEHFLGLRGSETWSEDGNESQVVIKTLIGQILTEKMPKKNAIPNLYLKFVEKLQPWDRIITFNYDVLLERACEVVGKPYRLVPSKYISATKSGGIIDLDSYGEEIIILKLHGSIDWFNRRNFRERQEEARERGHHDFVPSDPIFNSGGRYKLIPLIHGACPEDDPIREMYRLDNIEDLYRNPRMFEITPKLITPSTQKIVYANQIHDFWRGKGREGGHGFRMVIIGYSLPSHDSYARQVIYRLVTNYQDIPASRVDNRRRKEPLIMVDLCRNSAEKNKLKKNYKFVDWNRTKTFFGGLNEDAIKSL